MKPIIVLLSLIAAFPALAQQQPSAEIQALQAKLMAELNASLQCGTQAIQLAQDNAKLKARIEELEKAAPKDK